MQIPRITAQASGAVGQPRWLHRQDQIGRTDRVGNLGRYPTIALCVFAREEWSDLLVDQWVMAAATQSLWRSSSIGGWIDPSSGTVWLDVVRVVPAPFRAFAVLLGRLSNQHCVFDLGQGRTVVV